MFGNIMKFIVKLVVRKLVYDYKLLWKINKDIWYRGNGVNDRF